ncbi:MAG TPA: hypothetical protein PKC83_17345, partial [Gemmatimonadaceae bacterium]|nr:hypothetical protein [Gemmatimonadaceae bacterium]
ERQEIVLVERVCHAETERHLHACTRHPSIIMSTLPTTKQPWQHGDAQLSLSRHDENALLR